MNFLFILRESLANYPRGTLLILVALLNICWVFYIVLLKHNFRHALYRAYFLYAVFTLFWTISNAYFQSTFLAAYGEGMAKFMALFANVAATFGMAGFYYISSILKTGKKKLSKWAVGYIAFLTTSILVLNLIPGLTVKSVDIFSDGTFQLNFGPWNSLFFILATMTVVLSFLNFILAMRKKRPKIENIRFFYILFGMSLMYGSAILFSVVFPSFFNNYRLVWLPPVLSIIDTMIIGYALLAKRFFDIKLLILNLFKTVLNFFLSFSLSWVISFSLMDFIHAKGGTVWWYVFGAFLLFFFYRWINRFFSSSVFYRIFGRTQTEHFRHALAELRKRNKIYANVQEFEDDIRKISGDNCHIIVIDQKANKKYPKLIKYFKNHREVLVTEEIRFIESEREEIVPFLEELESLGGVCLPLFHPSRGLVGLFTLGKKSYDHFYSKEEIVALENINAYLSFVLTGILYSSELKAEVTEKTLKLEQQIHATNKLVKQQSDFMAVTAHEFRTPLSIALFQMDEVDTMRDKKNKAMNQSLASITEALTNLKKLTQKLFDVQQYDLDKVELKKENVNMKDFIDDIGKGFELIIMGKGLKFKVINKLKTNDFQDIDPSQMRQVLHNLLSNAYKFTEKGLITLEASQGKKGILIQVTDTGPGVPNDMKKTIFEKFRSGNTQAGIGLGLYICEKIVELHGGKIDVKDNLKGGAIFFIQLPK